MRYLLESEDSGAGGGAIVTELILSLPGRKQYSFGRTYANPAAPQSRVYYTKVAPGRAPFSIYRKMHENYKHNGRADVVFMAITCAAFDVGSRFNMGVFEMIDKHRRRTSANRT